MTSVTGPVGVRAALSGAAHSRPSGSRARLTRRAGLALAVGLAALVAGASPAVAQLPTIIPSPAPISSPPAGESDAISWAVDPATADGPDGRAWAELVLDPGQQVTDHLAVRNLGKQEVTFALTAADGYFTDKGRFSMLTSDRTSVAAGTWIDVQDAVTVQPGGTAVVPFSVSVPDNATPGDHAAGIAASVLMIDGSGGAVNVESRIGFRVMTRVTGDLAPALSIENLDSTYDMTWNPVEPGAVDVQVLLSNPGNVALTVEAVVAAGGASAPLGLDGAPSVELLPGDERMVTARVTDVWPMGPVGTEITARATVQGTETALPAVTASVTTWAVPWSQLIVLVAAALLILAWRSSTRRRAVRLQELLDRARDEGRVSAAPGELTGSTAGPRRQ